MVMLDIQIILIYIEVEFRQKLDYLLTTLP